MSRKIPLVVILLALTASLASADIGLVADIDGDYTNGPDTLLMDPGDTVQVNIWITGADSLVGFGITLGDTSGALTWIEEADSLIYTTPAGWTDISIQTDSLGWALLQSSDFAFSTPLVLPSKVAEMNFVVAPGESCGVIAFDSEMSGWQSWEFEEGIFALTTGLSPCNPSGGESLGGGGEGSSPDPDPNQGDDGEPATPTSLTRSFSVSDEDFLFIHGHRIRGTVMCTWTSGGPLRVNQYQILPPPNRIILPLSEAELEQMSANKPVVRALVDSGLSWRESVLEWERQIEEVEWDLIAIYHQVINDSNSASAARDAVLAAVSSATHLIAAEDSPAWIGDRLKFRWEGERFPTYMHESALRNTQPRQTVEVPSGPSYAKALRLITTMRDILQARGPSLFVLSSSGSQASRVRVGMSGEEFRESVLSQISRSSREDIAEGFLGGDAVREIVEQGGLDQ